MLFFLSQVLSSANPWFWDDQLPHSSSPEENNSRILKDAPLLELPLFNLDKHFKENLMRVSFVLIDR